MMAVNVEKLADAGKRYIKKMDLEDMAALKICLLSTGALAGLSLKSRMARRLVGVDHAASFLSAGLAIPLVSQYLDELHAAGIRRGVSCGRTRCKTTPRSSRFKGKRRMPPRRGGILQLVEKASQSFAPAGAEGGGHPFSAAACAWQKTHLSP